MNSMKVPIWKCWDIARWVAGKERPSNGQDHFVCRAFWVLWWHHDFDCQWGVEDHRPPNDQWNAFRKNLGACHRVVRSQVPCPPQLWVAEAVCRSCQYLANWQLCFWVLRQMWWHVPHLDCQRGDIGFKRWAFWALYIVQCIYLNIEHCTAVKHTLAHTHAGNESSLFKFYLVQRTAGTHKKTSH